MNKPPYRQSYPGKPVVGMRATPKPPKPTPAPDSDPVVVHVDGPFSVEEILASMFGGDKRLCYRIVERDTEGKKIRLHRTYYWGDILWWSKESAMREVRQLAAIARHNARKAEKERRAKMSEEELKQECLNDVAQAVRAAQVDKILDKFLEDECPPLDGLVADQLPEGTTPLTGDSFREAREVSWIDPEGVKEAAETFRLHGQAQNWPTPSEPRRDVLKNCYRIIRGMVIRITIKTDEMVSDPMSSEKTIRKDELTIYIQETPEGDPTGPIWRFQDVYCGERLTVNSEVLILQDIRNPKNIEIVDLDNVHTVPHHKGDPESC